MCKQGSFTWNSESSDLGTPCLHPKRKCHMALCVHKVSFTWNSESNDLRTPCLHIEAPPVTLVPTGGRKLGQQNIPRADLCQCLCYPLSCLACLILHKIMLFTAHQVLLGTANDLLCKEVNFNMIFIGLVYSLKDTSLNFCSNFQNAVATPLNSQTVKEIDLLG